jgi:hypothetical protein
LCIPACVHFCTDWNYFHACICIPINQYILEPIAFVFKSVYIPLLAALNAGYFLFESYILTPSQALFIQFVQMMQKIFDEIAEIWTSTTEFVQSLLSRFI